MYRRSVESVTTPAVADPLASWLTALERRHLAELTPAELARALRALSSCYVERRAKLPEGAALNSAGKRAAFALFYAPLHFLTTREVVRAIPAVIERVTELLDLGCGTGAAGAAWALERGGGVRVTGVDRNAWAVEEATWTYRQLRLSGRAARGDVERVRLPSGGERAILAAYTVNELRDETRSALLPRLLDAHANGTRVVVIEPIARRMSSWWDDWERAFTRVGGTAAEWRFAVALPERQRALGRAAGLDPRELTVRTLSL